MSNPRTIAINEAWEDLDREYSNAEWTSYECGFNAGERFGKTQELPPGAVVLMDALNRAERQLTAWRTYLSKKEMSDTNISMMNALAEEIRAIRQALAAYEGSSHEVDV